MYGKFFACEDFNHHIEGNVKMIIEDNVAIIKITYSGERMTIELYGQIIHVGGKPKRKGRWTIYGSEKFGIRVDNFLVYEFGYFKDDHLICGSKYLLGPIRKEYHISSIDGVESKETRVIVGHISEKLIGDATPTIGNYRIERKGKFINDRFIEGIEIIKGKYLRIRKGNFEDGFFGTEETTTNNSKIKRIGSLKDGKFIGDRIMITEFSQISNINGVSMEKHGIFNDGMLIQGYVETTFDSKTTRLEGKFENDHLVDGRMIVGEDSYEGIFEYGVLVFGDRYVNGIFESGIFENGVILYGIKRMKNKVYTGYFQNGALTDGSIQNDGYTLVGQFEGKNFTNGYSVSSDFITANEYDIYASKKDGYFVLNMRGIKFIIRGLKLYQRVLVHCRKPTKNSLMRKGHAVYKEVFICYIHQMVWPY